MVVVRFAKSDQCRRAYRVYFATRHRRSSDGSASPVMDRVLSGVFPEPIPFCGEERDEILDRALSMPGSHGRCLRGFVSSDSQAHTVPGAQIFRSQLIGTDCSEPKECRDLTKV